ncbi:MAG: 50S ribosomal protein L21 [Candidatus Portnoybacteria bacterium CG_4_8_14_3_um_filter_44_15]|uniref:Large ribosomal subunit protein bL21 n=4 Tax=Candidatus Portnoyibacteriota TaxID=1817913 RepID=A0A2M7YLI4_9BACT|nr:MAG: 50S ribosomal protein L21 [Parcubacteria group bacterium CG1_02_44_65]PIP15903.1 MAG: 50S ribosomal protein L21 [Candidatus Portnoybacteria bacterium CG23_combo_of_CG06-09_8_20_14_all_44_36]PIW74848.1 MAG: 50S ribosomal protein L21 [Candidatus Portnoybacteria bacterium CG_4_8_14_3_um_filter_44_15]PIZ69084.1 MAG: 50S ribosomal protein L21 [Candidatus Portnoybacteria bacterium CG_4_10_14_0_2_um_filter_43_36]PJA63830.1 MAG: 50S ribosomal protein L21 [Candidatus Portnoybacteria bacterium CG
MFAVIKTGGKQYLVSAGDKIKVEKLDAAEGKDVVFDEVLLVAGDKTTEIGTPLVKGAKVKGKIIKQGRAKKVIIFRYKPKKRQQKKKGHRQPFSEVEITEILLSAQKSVG